MSFTPDDRQSQIAAACSVLVRQVLATKNWRPARLAQELGVHPDLVRRWVRGERMIQLDDLLTIADMIGASLDEVFAPARKAAQPSRPVGELKAEAVAGAILRQLGQLLAAAPAGAAPLAAPLRSAGQGPPIDHALENISTQAQQALTDLIEQSKPKRRRRTA